MEKTFIIGTIGAPDHGKTMLTSAITCVLEKKGLARYIPYDKFSEISTQVLLGCSSVGRTRDSESRSLRFDPSHPSHF